MRRGLEVGPLAARRVVAERGPAGVEVEGFRVRVVVVLLAEGEGAVHGPVRARRAGGVGEAPRLARPRRRRHRADLRPPRRAGREFIARLPGRVEREHVVRPRLLVVTPRRATPEHEEPLRRRVVADGHVPAPALDSGVGLHPDVRLGGGRGRGGEEHQEPVEASHGRPPSRGMRPALVPLPYPVRLRWARDGRRLSPPRLPPGRTPLLPELPGSAVDSFFSASAAPGRGNGRWVYTDQRYTNVDAVFFFCLLGFPLFPMRVAHGMVFRYKPGVVPAGHRVVPDPLEPRHPAPGLGPPRVAGADVELLNAATGERTVAVTAAAVRAAYPGLVAELFGQPRSSCTTRSSARTGGGSTSTPATGRGRGCSSPSVATSTSADAATVPTNSTAGPVVGLAADTRRARREGNRRPRTLRRRSASGGRLY